MTYIYDVLLNFTDEDRLIEFFEWEEADILEHIKRIPLVRISSKQLSELLKSAVNLEKPFLDKIKGLTTLYKKTKNLEYALLVSDLNKVIGLEFNSNGELISRSSLLLDEEEEIIEECCDLTEERLPYKIIHKNSPTVFLTRQELKRRNYLLKEIETLFKENNVDKLNYLYEELYHNIDGSLQDKYLHIKKDLETNYSSVHNDLYDIVRLSYIKK